MHVFDLNIAHCHIAGVGDGVSIGNRLTNNHGGRGCCISFGDGEIGCGRAIVGDHAADIIRGLNGEVDRHGVEGRNRSSARVVIRTGHGLGIAGDQRC